jgi:hypothetical protein
MEQESVFLKDEKNKLILFYMPDWPWCNGPGHSFVEDHGY